MKITLSDLIESSLDSDDVGPCVRDNDKMLDRWSGGYLPDDERRNFYRHLYRCEECREFVRDLVNRNLLSVPR